VQESEGGPIGTRGSGLRLTFPLRQLLPSQMRPEKPDQVRMRQWLPVWLPKTFKDQKGTPELSSEIPSDLLQLLVGVAGFEPAASSSRTKRAAKLRHTPPSAWAAGTPEGEPLEPPAV
jgi:hypothetical protein